MLQFKPAGTKWWNKPLVNFRSKVLPAELAVLHGDLQSGEAGVWLNSRSVTTGVADLLKIETKGSETKYQTLRIDVPEFVGDAIRMLYAASGLSKGCPDLVIWNLSTLTIRFTEVKCPHWDRVFKEQTEFMHVAEKHEIKTKEVEWEFASP
jgi:hypothetical protein